MYNKNKTEITLMIHKGSTALGTASKTFYWRALAGFTACQLGQMSVKTHTQNIITNNPQQKYRLGAVSKTILLEGLNQFHGVPTSPLVHMLIKTRGCLVCMKDP